MTVFSTIGLTYVVHKKNVNYINALIKHGQYVRIHEVNDEKKDEYNWQPLAAKLQEIMDAAADDESVVLECETTNSSSAAGVLPKIASDALLHSVPQKLSKSDQKIIQQSVGIISTYLRQVTDPRRNWDDIGAPPINHLDIVDINYTQAVHIVDQLQTKFDELQKRDVIDSGITGCLHIPKAKTILFQMDTALFTLQYGEDSRYGFCFPLYLHAGIGFGPNNALCKTPEDHPILKTLQKHFLAWKANNYQ